MPVDPVALALMGNTPTGELTAWNPSLRDRIAYMLSDAAGYLGAGRYGQQDVADKTRQMIDFIPGVGETLGADDTASSLEAGNYLDAGINLGATVLGAMPVAGDLAGKALRERYRSALMYAAPGKDVSRIKLTPERMEKAKEYVRDPVMANFGIPRGELVFPPTQQMLNAQDFARQMVRQGEDVRFRTPDGVGGSLYVRVGDKGTVRFADHPQPTEGGQIVGGYSKTLGRRHYPADYSVSPSEMTLPAVMSIFGLKP